MISCSECEGLKFIETEDGFYVCVDCGTQSHDYQSQIVDTFGMGTQQQRKKVSK
eukprot:Pgem_evm1s20189